MKIQELVEQEINVAALADEILKQGMQVTEIVKQLIDPESYKKGSLVFLVVSRLSLIMSPMIIRSS